MRSILVYLGTLGVAFFALRASSATLYVDLNSTSPLSPYAGWSTAATNIQDAIDASNGGDQIWVTNGIYSMGGKVMAGDLTNRVALDKAVTVQSVNGPWATVIQGAGAINGTAAVRCAWLTNNAVLAGFTLMWGGTRISGDTTTLRSGGGVWCASSNATVYNCLIRSNNANSYGGGVYQGTVNNSLISSNGNLTSLVGGACNAILNNCTIISNANYGVYQTSSGLLRATNCIIRYNSPNALSSCTLAYCCTVSSATGIGNFTNDPMFFVDGVHLANGSPCIGAGTGTPTGTDIFNKSWSNPPAVGCAEYDPSPLVTAPRLQLTSDPIGFTIGNVAINGQPPFTGWWLKDGVALQDNGHYNSTQTTNLAATGVSFADAGSYQLVVSNASGVVTSAVAPLVVHCVDVAGMNPVPPYSNWATAATNIQDAITAAAAGEVVLVTNGLYAVGGKSMDGIITNRVSVDKAILVQSVNGPNTTIIQGAWDPASTNGPGPGAVRCAWLTNNATLSGFTLRGGATRAVTGGGQSMSGGGVWGSLTNISPGATVANCVISGNAAADVGAGAYRVRANNCRITANTAAGSGGGAYYCTMRNCAVIGNTALNNGGGANSSSLINCTLTGNRLGNWSSGYGGGVADCSLSNCIVYANSATINSGTSNSYNSTFYYSCTAQAAGGTGNIATDPLLLADGAHLSAASPCIGAGAGIATLTDIDGQAWNSPPAMGCDEWHPAPVIGAPPSFQIGFPARGLTFNVIVAGQSPFIYFWNKDGVPIQDDGHYGNSGTANLVVNNFGPDDAGAYQVVVSNSFGVVTSEVAQVVIHVVDAVGSNPAAPYSTWATAATNIQDAIDIASAGDIVLVTNGIYATGGRVMYGDLTNRVVLDKPVTVTSVNGYSATVIQGAWDPVATNGVGPGAVRCTWLTNGAVLSGFTLQDGATRPFSGSTGGPLESGGAVWCASTNGVVFNCLLTNNCAVYGGGMAYGTLNNSLVVNNLALYGGGAYYATLNNCTVVNNYTTTWATYHGAGTYEGLTRNSIVLNYFDNYNICPLYSYSCTYPTNTLVGSGNINGGVNSPQFLDEFHIATTSPCRSTGSAQYASGTDLDGEPWSNPPSMGCDEVVLANLAGPLSVSLLASQTNFLMYRYTWFTGTITGRASRVEWSFGDGPTVTNAGASIAHQWLNAGDYTVTFTAFNNDHPAGVSTSVVVHVQLINAPLLYSPEMLTNGFLFRYAAQANVNYTYQYTTNLTPPVTWHTMFTISYTNSVNSGLLDATYGADAVRFYRILAQ
jgi:parallel beta-helix repeat protein